MVVNDYLTLFLTLQSWIISNKIFYILSSANLLILPLIVIVIASCTEAMKEGEDEGNKGLLSLNRSTVSLCLAMGAYVLVMIPSQPTKLATMQYNDVRSQQCGVSIIKPGDNTGSSWDKAYEQMGGETAKIPYWWKLIHNLSIGVTNAAIASIPCNYDVTRSQLKLSEVHIQSPALLQETQQFYEQCFATAKSSMIYEAYQGQGNSVTDRDLDNAQWLGDKYFLKYNTLAPHTTYPGLQSREAIPAMPYNASRDGLTNDIWAKRLNKSEPDKKAYPMCDEWWIDLKGRLSTEIQRTSPEIYRDVMQPQGWFDNLFKGEKTPDERQTMLVRRALSVENVYASGRTVKGYGAVIDKTADRATAETWGSTIGGVGLLAGRAFAEPTFFIVREALPIFQALLLSVIIIGTPIIIPLALYEWRVVMTITIAYFGTQFFTFWWEWCRSLESNLLTAMYAGHNFDMLDPISYSAGAMNALNSEIIRVALLTLYVVIPGIWLAVLGFAGHQVTSMSSGFNEGLNSVKGATDRGISKLFSLKSGPAK